jgi:hypothetical protein
MTRDFSFNLTQTANGKPRGSVRFRDPKSGTEFRMVEAGLLQTYDKWASFTARVRTKDSAAEQVALVVLDGGNPMLTQATIRVELSDGRRMEATLKSNEFKVGNRR